MKLYLSSFHLGDDPQRMLHPGARNRRVGVIQNALDCYSDTARRRHELESEFADLRSLGLEPEELDLREYFGKSDELRKRLSSFSYVWVVGGNSFVLRRAYAQSGFDRLLSELSYDDTFVYAGFSAGVCVLAPTLKGIHLADDPNAEASGYASGILWDGIGIIPFAVAPHYKSVHHESAMIDEAVNYFIAHKIPFVALKDGEALVLDSKDISSLYRSLSQS